jgi:hypothetical protein
VTNKGKALIARKERALTKSQHTGGLIDKHLGQLSEQKLRDSEEIHEIETPDGGEYWGQIKDGFPDGKGEKFIDDGEVVRHIRGEWTQGRLEGFGVVAVSQEFAKGPSIQTISIGRYQGNQSHGLGAELFVNWFEDVEGGDGYDFPDLSLGQTQAGDLGICPSLTSFRNEVWWTRNWGDLDSFFVGVHEKTGVDTQGLFFEDGAVRKVCEFGYDSRIVEKSESDAILNDLYIDSERQLIRWQGPTGTSAEGAWITADVRGHSIGVLKLKSPGLTEGVRSKITSDKVVEISCGEWRPGEKFSGIRFELNSNFDKSRGPWFYKEGKQIAFPLFDDELDEVW